MPSDSGALARHIVEARLGGARHPKGGVCGRRLTGVLALVERWLGRYGDGLWNKGIDALTTHGDRDTASKRRAPCRQPQRLGWQKGVPLQTDLSLATECEPCVEGALNEQ